MTNQGPKYIAASLNDDGQFGYVFQRQADGTYSKHASTQDLTTAFELAGALNDREDLRAADHA